MNTREPGKLLMKLEGRRQAILAGSIGTMVGIVGYLAAMTRAGSNASIVDVFTNQSLLGYASAAALMSGVVIWLAGNFSALQDFAQLPGKQEE